MRATLYHKPTCSTCQKVLKALKEKGAEITAIEYLKNPPSPRELGQIVDKLGGDVMALVRKKEPLFQETYADKKMSRSDWLKTLYENPELIERPIVLMDGKAVVARPPEKLDLLFK